MSRIICFSIGAFVLLAAVNASPVDKEEEENKSGWAATTVAPGWDATTPGWGWVAPVVEGDNAAYGQTLVIQELAANQTNSAPSALEAIAFDDYATTLFSGSSQVSDIQANSNSWAPGGGGAEAGDYTAYTESGGPYNAFNQGAAQNNSVYITNALLGGIISNPQTTSAISAGQLVVSSSGQASNGTNVNPGANSGWGNSWGATNSGWKADDKKNPKGGKRRRAQPQRSSGWGSGWTANSTGSSASSSSLGSGTNISQAASSSDNITAIAVQDYDYYPMELDVAINQEAPVESFFNGNGVTASSEGASAGTEWQNFEIASYPVNNVTLEVYDYAAEVAVQVAPNSTTTFSIGNITVSDWATASSGTNMVNQNNGWGSSPGWVAPAAAPAPSGWKAPLVEQMGYPVV